MRLRAVAASLLGLLSLLLAGQAQATGRPSHPDAGHLAPPSGPGLRVLAGRPCRLIGLPTAAPVGTTACGGVRPGGLVEVPAGLCTLNFLFVGSDGSRYVGTAGHCALAGNGERVWSTGGPPAKVEGAVVGEFAYAVLDDRRDFSLIRLHRGVAASPAVCHFGGPTGVAGDSAWPVVLQHYGHGLGVGLVPARTGIATSMQDPDVVAAVLAATPGDSGSAVIDSAGGAVGVLVALEPAITNGLIAGVGPVLITRIEPQRERARSMLGLASLTLTTAPLA